MSRRLKINKKAIYKIVRDIQMIVFDFDGVFTDNRVFVFEDGREGVLCYRSDGLGLEALRKKGMELAVISTEVNPVVNKRCQKLQISCIQGQKDKLEILKSYTRRLTISLDKVAFVGNDINDAECLKIVGLPICVADAHPHVLPFAKYVTKARGGRGAVREVCDLFLGLPKIRKAIK